MEDLFVRAVLDEDMLVQKDEDIEYTEPEKTGPSNSNKFWRAAGRRLRKEFLNEDPARRQNKRLRYKEGMKRARRHYNVVWRSWLDKGAPSRGNPVDWMTDYERNSYKLYSENADKGTDKERHFARYMADRCIRMGLHRFKSYCKYRKTRPGDFLTDRTYRSEMNANRRKAAAEADWDEFLDVKRFCDENGLAEVASGTFKKPPLKRQISKKNWSCGR